MPALRPPPVRATPWAGSAPAWLLAAGACAAIATVTAEGRLGPRDPRAIDPTSWLGILPPAPPTGTTRGALAGIAALAVIALCALWITLVRGAWTGRLGARAVSAASLAWCAPFALGPPLFSRDAYAYAAQGELARRGLDPATHGVLALAADPSGAVFSDAVDPRWRETHTPYGGAAVAVEKAAAAVGHLFGVGPAGALVTLRVVALVSVAVLVCCTVRLAQGAAGAPAAPTDGGDVIGGPSGDRVRAVALALVAANPVTLIHLVGGAHLDALVAAALAGALLVDRYGRRPPAGAPDTPGPLSWPAVAATALACLAGMVKATALLGVAWLVLAHARRARSSGPRAVAAAVAVDLVVTAGVGGLSVLASGFAPTWIGALATSSELTTGIAPASILATLLSALASLVGVDVAAGRGSALLAGCRAVTLAAAGVVVAVLLWRGWRGRPRDGQAPDGERDGSDEWDGLKVLGVGGLAVALGSPVLYPWYLAPALPMLAVLTARGPSRRASRVAGPPDLEAGPEGPRPLADTADDRAEHGGGAAGRRPRPSWIGVGAVCALSVWLCLATLSPLAETWRLLGPRGPAGPVPLVAAVAVATAALTAAGAAGARALAGGQRRRRRAAAR
ncbi:hypothetical protein [Frankia nepalensis]|uniref:hypothetical protein n=1 Tax=Frankia nepalensis TaxID=1836974 RepID=UPI001EE4334D|nr:hypothetical protein [Frankia nepalensis]